MSELPHKTIKWYQSQSMFHHINKKHVKINNYKVIQTSICWVGEQGFLSGVQNSPKILLWDIENKKVSL
jgi:hypothetical protein